MRIDREKLDRVINLVSRLIRSHGGGIELTGVTEEGTVSVRFTGMCTGCELKPITAVTAIRPALMEVDGVTDVQVAGVCLSAELKTKLAQGQDSAMPQDHIIRIVRDTLRNYHETSFV
ncbi:NifU family protein [Paraburkholderia sediminicola]|uniref:NifU family protein n=1 Tax=Paraburkholderia sediminicola TaxID=458836 RepID=UPI0038BC2C6F